MSTFFLISLVQFIPLNSNFASCSGQNLATLPFILFTSMSPESIVGFTVAISVAFAYLEPIHSDLNTAQTMQEARIQEFDQIITGCRVLLEQCGRPRFLESIWNLWTQLSNSLYMMERTLWPTQAPETPLNIVLPPESRPLSDILLDGFDDSAPCIAPAIQALESFRDWFVLSYDPRVHADLHALLADALLIFRTAEAILRLKRRCQTLQQVTVSDPIDLDPTPSDEPAASSTHAPAGRSAALHGDTGGHLEWY